MKTLILSKTGRKGKKPQRLLYRAGVTRDELSRLVAEVGRDQVEAVLKGLDLQTSFEFGLAD
jgi:hypothetical protein